jgi:argininosuccinate lyase
MSKLWGGRFEKDLNGQVAEFSSSLEIDTRLWQADITGSIAHARMLGRQGILTPQEASAITEGLSQVQSELSDAFEKMVGKMGSASPFNPDAEDVHSEIERLLREKIGPLAGKLHTARSRNDQVATACRLYISQEAAVLQLELRRLQIWIVDTAKNETETLLPGLTHFQHGQPVSLAHHLLAYFWMFERDHTRLSDFSKRCLMLPLGSAALAGTSFPLDRESVANELGFIGLCENSMDAVSDRDFVVEFLSATSLILMHLSRLSEEIIIWSAPEHGFLSLDDSVTTGSSIMPQKKNPDVAELIRGRCGRAYGSLMGAFTLMKSLPLAYNRDQQEDKFHLFQGLDNALACVRLMTIMLETAVFNRERMKASLRGDFSNATDLADDLAKKGLPFREAHEVIGRIVRHCIDNNVALEDLELKDLKSFHPLFDEGALKILPHAAVMHARTSRGGTSPSAVKFQIERAAEILK